MPPTSARRPNSSRESRRRQTALWRSVRARKNDFPRGHAARLNVAASREGRTSWASPRVAHRLSWETLAEARRLGRKPSCSVLIRHSKCRAHPSFSYHRAGCRPRNPTGSTRLKAGTATKLILNIFTTVAMVRLGKVTGNLMTDLNPSNVKLRDRATRIVQEFRKVDYATARRRAGTFPVGGKKGVRQTAPKGRMNS